MRESGDPDKTQVCDFGIETRETIEFLIRAATTLARGERLFPYYEK